MNTPSVNPHSVRWRPMVRFTVAIVVATVFVIVALARPSHAAQTGDWDGIDPKGTTCNNDAATVASAVIAFEGHRLGTVELRYSKTCRTAWARLDNDMKHVPGDAHSGYTDIVRDSDGKTYTCSSPPGENTTCWTKMVDDTGVTAHAYGNIDPYPTYGYGTAEARTKSH